MGFRGRTKAERQVAIDGVRFRYHGAAYILVRDKGEIFILYFHSGGTADKNLFVPSIFGYSGRFVFAKENVMFVLSGRWRDLNITIHHKPA